jgi:hypothetical protein
MESRVHLNFVEVFVGGVGIERDSTEKEGAAAITVDGMTVSSGG